MSPATPIGNIQAAVAAHFKLPRRLMTSREAARPAPQARQVAMYLAHTLLGKGTSELGRRFHRDHSTVAHGIRRVEQSTELRGMAEKLAETLRYPQGHGAQSAPENAIEQGVNKQAERYAA